MINKRVSDKQEGKVDVDLATEPLNTGQVPI